MHGGSRGRVVVRCVNRRCYNNRYCVPRGICLSVRNCVGRNRELDGIFCQRHGREIDRNGATKIGGSNLYLKCKDPGKTLRVLHVKCALYEGSANKNGKSSSLKTGTKGSHLGSTVVKGIIRAELTKLLSHVAKGMG